MFMSKNVCKKCNRGILRLQWDIYSTYFSCITCGASVPTKCPHCDMPSIAVEVNDDSIKIWCRSCECANGELAVAECVNQPAVASA